VTGGISELTLRFATQSDGTLVCGRGAAVCRAESL
jgi:hypothetical protein